VCVCVCVSYLPDRCDPPTKDRFSTLPRVMRALRPGVGYIVHVHDRTFRSTAGMLCISFKNYQWFSTCFVQPNIAPAGNGGSVDSDTYARLLSSHPTVRRRRTDNSFHREQHDNEIETRLLRNEPVETNKHRVGECLNDVITVNRIVPLEIN